MAKQSSKLLATLALIGLFYLSLASQETDVATNFVNIAPASQILIGNTLYYVERIGKNWFDARKSCESMGYNLVSLETQEKFNAINNFLDNQMDKDSYWTSGNDLRTLGHHVWFPSGVPVPSHYWYPGAPSNSNGIEHCDVIRSGQTRLLNDKDCTISRYYICERNL